jgi:hypothetical protein
MTLHEVVVDDAKRNAKVFRGHVYARLHALRTAHAMWLRRDLRRQRDMIAAYQAGRIAVAR